ncbi:glycoside hydrolase superfamily [Aspergillus varians]
MAAPSPPSISLHITLFIAEENVEKFFEAFRPVYEKVIAEPECTFFELYQSQSDPGEISLVENWSASVEWLMGVQIKKDYYLPFFEATEPMFVKPREAKVVNRVGAPYVTVKKENGGLLDPYNSPISTISQPAIGPTQYANPTRNSPVQSSTAPPTKLGFTSRNKSAVIPAPTHSRAHVSPSEVTHLNYAFAIIDPTTFEMNLAWSSEVDLIKRLAYLKNDDPDVKVFISIGGWRFNDPGATRTTFSDLAASRDAQNKFFRSLISFLSTYNLDGVDMIPA